MSEDNIKAIKFHFDSTEDRDTFMDAHFKDRQCSDCPGLFFLTNGEQVGVFCNDVTYYKDISDGDVQTAAEYYYDKQEFATNKRPIPADDSIYDHDWYRESENQRIMEEDKGDHWIWE
jgi:hypothetical protein